MQLKKILPLAAIAALLPGLALAQEAEAVADAMEAVTALNTEMVFIMNSLLFLVGGFLVFFMAAGFCMLETGLVRSKNATMQATKNVALFSLATIAYFLIGFNLMYPLGDWVIEGWLGGISPTVLEPVGVALEDVDDIEYASIGSDFIFQLMFCAAVASIVSGAVAERIKLWPFLAFVVILTGVIYPIQASWSWGEGFLDEMGFSDFAGSSIVHAAGGWAALAGVIVLGARYGKYSSDGKVTVMPGSNLPLATLGMFILWLGWFGFNGGSQLAMGTISDVADVSRIFSNTNTAAAGGAVTALILSTLLYKKPDLTMVLNGALAGLVSITAEPLTPGLGSATLIGAVGGVIVVLTIPLLDKFKIDDVVGAIPVHLFAGLWGTMAVPLTNSDASFVTQFIGMAAIGIFMFFASLVVWLILKAVMGIRVSDEDQVTGLDKTEMGMEAYPEFSNR
ncbi:ammonium transporter [Roseinatronobacter monicus]|uniref:Ammonium transporter n=1 Tax=Roseinatronobacter monicus TaxID=393481 RepID=A0A543K9Q3_9RHOB|nr:ammonium transporter [Roseinatronobacter monicus]TQM91805.1 ammonium transporter [Roseinatronobacter monicus]